MTIEDSVAKTYKYGKIFDYPQTAEDLHLWLVSSKVVSLPKIPSSLVKKLSKKDYLKKRKRHNSSLYKISLIQKKTKALHFFPFVRFVGVTGSTSAYNAKDKDDIDIFIITAPYTLWIIRPFILIFLEITGNRRAWHTNKNKAKNLVCPNLWLDHSSLKISTERRSLYTAHEVLQIIPIINKKHTYELFINKNSWVRSFLANAYAAKKNTSLKVRPETGCLLLQPINYLFFIAQKLFMSMHGSQREVTLGKAFFHNPNYANKVLKAFTKKL